MRIRARAMDRSGGKAGSKYMTMASTAPKRIGTAKKSAPAKKAMAAKPAKKPASVKAKKAVPVKKSAAAPAVKKPAPVKQPQAQPSKSAAAPKLETTVANGNGAPKAAATAKPVAAAHPRPAASNQSLDERRKAATRKFFARLRSLEAIVGADLRKRGSVVLMQAVDQWYNEAINANATDVSITNAAKVVIAHL